MLTKDFDYHLPEELIAQHPLEPRDASRMLVVRRESDDLEHRIFTDIEELLQPGDLLIYNNTRVIPARLQARKVPSGGRVELLLLARREPLCWEALVKGRRAAEGQELAIETADGQQLVGQIERITESGGRLIRFSSPIEPYLDAVGEVPLPPYIHAALGDPERYQTIYSRVRGSVAAPTAGLHFTPELVERTLAKGVIWAPVLLHIGLDTFRPVTEEVVEEHTIHTEYCQLLPETAQAINQAKAEGRRVIAVGTTSVRVVESAARQAVGPLGPWDGPTDLFIYPGYRFRVIDALITNFHLPRSSLIMLVSAFAGTGLIRKAYEEAISRRYRFFSFGDSMFIM